MESLADTTKYDIGRLPAQHRAVSWREAICSTFVSVDCRIGDVESFTGTIATRRLADLKISRVRSGRHDILRAASYRTADVTSAILVGYQRRGTSCVVQDGRAADLKPGQFALYDTARPYELHLGACCEQIVLRFPAELAEARFGRTSDLTARTMGNNLSLSRLASAMFQRLSRVDAVYGAMAEHHLCDVASSVIAANVAAVVECLPDSQRSGRALILMRGKAFIADNIGRYDLTSRAVANGTGVSIRYLQELFQAEGTTLMSYVWESRLQRARRMLDESTRLGSSISEIALACGFKDFSHFSRRFRETFGTSASAFRRRERARSGEG